MTQITSEVCVESRSGALSAQKAGAHRIELCAELVVGGVTPSLGLMRSVCQLAIPTVVLIRPRSGDFVYSEDEVVAMEEDIGAALQEGACGVAVGALLPNGDVDVAVMARLIRAAGDMSVCFHRAFDGLRDGLGALQALHELGVCRVLTSGQEADVVRGISFLSSSIRAAPKGLEVMPGGGVRAENVVQVLRETGAMSIHFSARVTAPPVMKHFNAKVDMHDPANQRALVASEREIRRYLDAIATV